MKRVPSLGHIIILPIEPKISMWFSSVRKPYRILFSSFRGFAFDTFSSVFSRLFWKYVLLEIHVRCVFRGRIVSVSYACQLTTFTTVDAVEAAFATLLTEEAAAKSGETGTEASSIL